MVSSVERAVLNSCKPHAGFAPINLTSCEVGNQSKLPVLFEPVSIFVNLQFGANPCTETRMTFGICYTKKIYPLMRLVITVTR